MLTILISATFRGEALIRGKALISMWIPKGVAFIRGRRLLETRHLLEEIRYVDSIFNSLKQYHKDINK